MVWSGATTIENEAMNLCKYSDVPIKNLNSMTFVGTGHLMMASIFVGSILISPMMRNKCSHVINQEREDTYKQELNGNHRHNTQIFFHGNPKSEKPTFLENISLLLS
jgi:hypothetical protein